MLSIILKLMFRHAQLKSSLGRSSSSNIIKPTIIFKLLISAASLAAVTACGQSTLPSISESQAKTEISVTNLEIDKNKILASHNSIRKRLGVPPLRWSSNLEGLASNWVNYLTIDAGCTVRRRGLIGLPQHKNGIGENLQRHESIRFGDGRMEVADIDEHQVVLNWARQGIDYSYTTNSCALNKDCENYTQLVWRDSQVVGCAAASCPNLDQIWVCNYDPPGNYYNQKPY